MWAIGMPNFFLPWKQKFVKHGILSLRKQVYPWNRVGFEYGLKLKLPIGTRNYKGNLFTVCFVTRGLYALQISIFVRDWNTIFLPFCKKMKSSLLGKLSSFSFLFCREKIAGPNNKRIGHMENESSYIHSNTYIPSWRHKLKLHIKKNFPLHPACLISAALSHVNPLVIWPHANL